MSSHNFIQKSNLERDVIFQI